MRCVDSSVLPALMNPWSHKRATSDSSMIRRTPDALRDLVVPPSPSCRKSVLIHARATTSVARAFAAAAHRRGLTTSAALRDAMSLWLAADVQSVREEVRNPDLGYWSFASSLPPE